MKSRLKDSLRIVWVSVYYRFWTYLFIFEDLLGVNSVARWYSTRQIALHNSTLEISAVPGVLALCPERFRGELEAFEKSGYFSIIRMPTELVKLLNAVYIQNPEHPHGHYGKEVYYQPDKSNTFRDQLGKQKLYYQRMLVPVFEKLKCKLIIAPNFTMPHYDLVGVTGKENGIPYVVLHREGLVMAPGLIDRDIRWAQMAGRFQGNLVIVHSKAQKEALIKGGLGTPETVTALGCVRMDGLIRKLNLKKKELQKSMKPSLLLFSFTPGYGLTGLTGLRQDRYIPNDSTFGLQKLFLSVHGVVGEIAKENPGVTVTIKLKDPDLDWRKLVLDALRKRDIDPEALPNLTITDGENAHDLIDTATVVTGYGSTALLEAGVAGRPVIFPFFDEVEEEVYQPYIFFRDHLELFDVARSRLEYKQHILSQLKEPRVTKETLDARYKVFDDYVSSLDGQALERHIAKFTELISAPRKPPGLGQNHR
jgi:hypothetical protein